MKKLDKIAMCKQEEIWTEVLKNKNVALWIMYANFFMGMLPGVLILQRKLQNTTKNEKFKIADYIAFILPILISVFQMMKFKRLMGMRMYKSVFVGQIISLAFIIIASSDNYLEKLRDLLKDKTANNGLLAFLTFILSILIFCVYVFGLKLSELNHISKCKML